MTGRLRSGHLDPGAVVGFMITWVVKFGICNMRPYLPEGNRDPDAHCVEDLRKQIRKKRRCLQL
jgi:hypothetical protein